MATVSCPAARFLAHGQLARTALLAGECHARYLFSCSSQLSLSAPGPTAVALLFASLSQQTDSTDWPLPGPLVLGADVYIFPTLTTT